MLAARGLAESLATDFAEGLAKIVLKIARVMKAEGFDAINIAGVTGLTPTDIQRL